MKYEEISAKKYIIRLEKGEEAMSVLTSFFEDKKIVSGFFYGLGAVKKAELAWYSLSEKQYYKKIFDAKKKDFQLLNCTGSVALVDGKPFTHLHATLSNTKYEAFGGHVFCLVAGPTMEIFLETFDQPITRTMDCDIGLQLLDLEH